MGLKVQQPLSLVPCHVGRALMDRGQFTVAVSTRQVGKTACVAAVLMTLGPKRRSTISAVQTQMCVNHSTVRVVSSNFSSDLSLWGLSKSVEISELTTLVDLYSLVTEV